MKTCKLPPLIEQVFVKIGFLYEAYQLFSNLSSNNPYIPKSFREEGIRFMHLYRDMLICEFDIVKNILLECMEEEELYVTH